MREATGVNGFLRALGMVPYLIQSRWAAIGSLRTATDKPLTMPGTVHHTLWEGRMKNITAFIPTHITV